MHPVLPSTTVRGPEAFTISFMTSADSQPWQVRWPELKNSSTGIFFTDWKGCNGCVGSIFTNVDIGSSSFLANQAPGKNRLLAQSDPLGQGLGLAFRSPVGRLG